MTTSLSSSELAGRLERLASERDYLRSVWGRFEHDHERKLAHIERRIAKLTADLGEQR